MFHHSEQQLPTALNSYLDFPESPEFPDTLESPENQKNGGYLHPTVAIGGTAPLIGP